MFINKQYLRMALENKLNCINNPLIARKDNYNYNNEEYNFTRNNLLKHFKKVYILCKLNNSIDYEKILYSNIESEELQNILQLFVLYESNNSIIFNEKLFSKLLIINSDDIIKSNHFGYQLDDQILILPIFNISFLNIQNHIDNISNNLNTFDKCYNDIIIKNNLNYELNLPNLYNILEMIENLTIDKYWHLMKNCNININSEINKRTFPVSKRINNSNIIASAMSKVNKDVNYFDTIVDDKLSKKLNNNTNNEYSNKYYYLKDGSGYTNEEINNLVSYFDDKKNMYKYDIKYEKHIELLDDILTKFIFKLSFSKQFCHHLINNEKLYFYSLKLVGTKYNYDMFIKVFRYTWTRLYMDERLKEGFLNTNDEIIFNINVASKLPYFGVDYVAYNPYISIPINEKYFDGRFSIFGCNNNIVPNDNPNKVLGINNFDQFKKNLNEFISGSDIFNIFDGINFKNNKMAITGSAMPACIQKNNPLSFMFDSQYRYFAEYYCNSDIDVMIKTNDIIEFLNICSNVFLQMKKNIINYFDYNFINYDIKKNIYVYISKNFIIENIKEYSLDYVLENINSDNIINILLPYIEVKFEEYVNELNIPDEFNSLNVFDKSLVNVMVYVNESDYHDNINVKYNIKYNITSKYLSRKLELFMIAGNDFMNVVSKFHLPCVRAYYDGNNVYMTPSCITSYMTLLNMHYTYFSSNTTPMEIINKYRMRGFGTILNKNEINELFKYSCDTEFWRNLYDFNNISNVSLNMKNFLGYIPHTSTFFKPRKTNYAFYIENDYIEDNYNLNTLCKSSNSLYIYDDNFQIVKHLDKSLYKYNIRRKNGNLFKLTPLVYSDLKN